MSWSLCAGLIQTPSPRPRFWAHTRVGRGADDDARLCPLEPLNLDIPLPLLPSMQLCRLMSGKAKDSRSIAFHLQRCIRRRSARRPCWARSTSARCSCACACSRDQPVAASCPCPSLLRRAARTSCRRREARGGRVAVSLLSSSPSSILHEFSSWAACPTNPTTWHAPIVACPIRRASTLGEQKGRLRRLRLARQHVRIHHELQ